jgi:hypothetical protein
MYGAYGTNGYVAAMGLSLTDPVFKRTYATLKFLPHLASDCTGATSSFAPDLPFGLANVAQAQIALKIGGWAPPTTESQGGQCLTNADCTTLTPTCLGAKGNLPGNCYGNLAPLDLQAAMRLDTGAYAQVLSFLTGKGVPNVAAAMFFVNRTPDSTGGGAFPSSPDCKPALGGSNALAAIESEALAAFHNKPTPLQTYFVVLNNDVQQPPVAFFQQVQNDLPKGAVTTLDATSTNAKQVLGSFAKAFTQLGTCVYGVPAGVTGTANATVQYGPPGAIAGAGEVVVPVDSTCEPATKDTANGWNIDTDGHIRICGAACTNLQNFVLGVSASATQNGQTVPDVPLGITTLCPGTTAPPPTDGGSTSVSDAGTTQTSESGTQTGSTDASTGGDATVPDAGAAASDAGAG